MLGSRGKSRRRRALLCGSLGSLAIMVGLLFGCVPADQGAAWVAGTVQSRAAAALPGPALTDIAFVTADGVSLPLRRWLPQGEAKAVILALHGFNDYSKAFEEPGAAWAAAGIATYAYDQRGFGAAPGRQLWPGSTRLAADADTAIALLRARYPGRPVFLLGESMGGAVAIDAATGNDGLPPANVDGMILSAPAVWGRETMDLVPKLALWAGVRLFPESTLTGQGLRIKASDNLPMLRALGRDPLVIKATRIDAVWGLVNLMDRALEAAPHLNTPCLLLYGAHDELIPSDAMRDFVARLPAGGGQRRLAFYPAGYHLLLRDLEGPTVAGDVATWVKDRNAPLPTHADRGELARPWPPSGDAMDREAVVPGAVVAH